jgi:hypothetical protein
MAESTLGQQWNGNPLMIWTTSDPSSQAGAVVHTAESNKSRQYISCADIRLAIVEVADLQRLAP